MSVADLYDLVKQGMTLEAAVERLWPGADPACWRRRLARYEPQAEPVTKPKRKRRRAPARRVNKRTFKASQILGSMSISAKERQDRATAKATGEAVDRANEGRSILVSSGDKFKVMEV